MPKVRAVAIRFGVVRFIVCAQERYTLGGSGAMFPQKNIGYEIAAETIFGAIRCFLEARRQSLT